VRAGRALHRLSAVFLDRDGVINRKAPEGEYVTSWSQFQFLPNALEGLRLLAHAGQPVVVVTNQRGIARGRMSESDLMEIHNRMRRAVADAGARIDEIYYCPHESGCDCRKPGTALFRRASQDLGIALADAAMIGDSASDMQAATAIGALRVFVGGHEDSIPETDHVAGDLLAAARWLLGDSAITGAPARADRP
jgi:D-glycero-D-manno-heptose 1,7-bisphosphate phosphatase